MKGENEERNGEKVACRDRLYSGRNVRRGRNEGGRREGGKEGKERSKGEMVECRYRLSWKECEKRKRGRRERGMGRKERSKGRKDRM